MSTCEKYKNILVRASDIKNILDSSLSVERKGSLLIAPDFLKEYRSVLDALGYPLEAFSRDIVDYLEEEDIESLSFSLENLRELIIENFPQWEVLHTMSQATEDYYEGDKLNESD